MIDLNVIDLEKYCVSIIYLKSKISFSCYYELFPYLTIDTNSSRTRSYNV